MNTLRPVAEPPPAARPVRAWLRFWFTPVDPVGLHVLRLLTGLVCLAWLLSFAGHVDTLFGLDGWFDRQAFAEAAALPDGAPRPLSWSVLYLCGGDARLLTAAYGLALVVLVALTVGLWPRVAAVLAWIVVASFTANPAQEADADPLLLILTFYLAVGYLLLGRTGPGRSWAARLLGPRAVWPLGGAATPPSAGANVALRLLQVHIAVLVVTSGLHKLQFGDWWAGVALWYPLHPPFETTLAAAREHTADRESYLLGLSATAYAMLAWQISFPAFAWRPRWRPVLLGGALVGWLGAALVYRLPFFGPAFGLGCLSYLTPDEWHRLGHGLGRLARPFGSAVGWSRRTEEPVGGLVRLTGTGLRS